MLRSDRPAPPVAQFAYEQLIAEVIGLIEGGTLRPGDRMPSVRRMSEQRDVSIPTVLEAYRRLEARRVIAARPRSGFYVLPPAATGGRRLARAATAGTPTMPEPREIATADLIMRCLEMVADPHLVPLGTALPDPDLLPSASLARHMTRAMRAHARRSTSVSTPSGTPELQFEIARRALEAGTTVAPEDVIITCGCAEALSLCLRAVTRPGDLVAVESPTYFGTLQALSALGLRALEIPTDPETGIDLSVLANALERGGVAAVVVTPTVHNPLGSSMPLAARQAIVDLAITYDLPLIEDDTYGELHFDEPRPRMLRSFDRAGVVLTCGSFSKTLAPGFRVGWAIPSRYRDRVLHFKLSTTAASPVPPQLALASYLASSGYDSHLRRLRRTFRSSLDRFAFEIGERLPAGTRVTRPSGGFLLWVELPAHVDAEALQRRALARGLSVAPGPAFSASGGYRHCIRVNAGYRWSDHAARALDEVGRLIAASG
jgi:DNA-binding transcriptional MocR family regulator